MSNLSGEIKCHQHDVKKNNCHNGKVLSRKYNHGAKLKILMIRHGEEEVRQSTIRGNVLHLQYRGKCILSKDEIN